MKRSSLAIFCSLSLAARGQQLAVPQMRFFGEKSLFFYEKAAVQPVLDLPGAEVRYTFDNSEPTAASPLAEPGKPIILTRNVRLRAAAFHPDFQKSNSRFWDFWKLDPATRPDSASLDAPPSKQYTARAADLFDAQSGSDDNLSDGHWLGFEGRPLVVRAFFRKKKRLSAVYVNCLVDSGAWIFPLGKISVAALSGKKVVSESGEFHISVGSKGREFCQYRFKKPVRAREVRLTVEPFGPLPPGHPGAGKPAWLFVDEVFFEK